MIYCFRTKEVRSFSSSLYELANQGLRVRISTAADRNFNVDMVTLPRFVLHEF